MEVFRKPTRQNCYSFLLVCVLLAEAETFFQNDYHLVFEHAALHGFNKSMLNYIFVKNVHLNRTVKAITVGFRAKYDLGGDAFKGRLEALQYYHNEYRRTPILFDIKLCDALQQNLFGLKVVLEEVGNLTTCPWKEDVYLINGFILNETAMPPHMPRGRWQIKFTTFQGEVWICTLSWFGAVEDIIKY